jgi:hypothetical protein
MFLLWLRRAQTPLQLEPGGAGGTAAISQITIADSSIEAIDARDDPKSEQGRTPAIGTGATPHGSSMRLGLGLGRITEGIRRSVSDNCGVGHHGSERILLVWACIRVCLWIGVWIGSGDNYQGNSTIGVITITNSTVTAWRGCSQPGNVSGSGSGIGTGKNSPVRGGSRVIHFFSAR